MCREYDEARAILADLIFELGDFTEDQLEKAFKQQRNGKIEIGRLQSIPDYLDELREYGALGFESGKYHVLERAPQLA